MHNPKIKKHFSLFMVQKTLKKQRKKKTKECHPKYEETIQKFIDPITYCRLPGDIIFMDKVYEEDVGLLSNYAYYKVMKKIEYRPGYNYLMAEFANKTNEFINWMLIYDRLLSLGNTEAYNLAQAIRMIYDIDQNRMNKQELQKGLANDSPDCAYKNFQKEFNEILSSKLNSVYFFAKYCFNTETNSLEVNGVGYSHKLVEIICGDISEFMNYLIDFSFFDFLTVEKDFYFEFIKNALLSVNAKNKFMNLKLQTLDGLFTNVVPNPITIFFSDENANIKEMFLFYEFDIREEFLEKLSRKREMKTEMRKKKTLREGLLESLLSIYYSNFELNAKESSKNQNHQTTNMEENLLAQKRCGYRVIKKEN